MGWNSSLCNHVQTVRIEWFTGFFEIWWFIIYTESAGWQNLIQFRSNSFFTICSCPLSGYSPKFDPPSMHLCTAMHIIYMYIFLNQKSAPSPSNVPPSAQRIRSDTHVGGSEKTWTCQCYCTEELLLHWKQFFPDGFSGPMVPVDPLGLQDAKSIAEKRIDL